MIPTYKAVVEKQIRRKISSLKKKWHYNDIKTICKIYSHTTVNISVLYHLLL